MATIIDSLFVEIGLETKKFQDGQKKVRTGLKEMGSDAAKNKKEIESFAKELDAAFSHLTSNVLKFSGALLGASGLTDLFVKLNQSNAEVYRSAQYIGTATSSLSKFEKMAERLGGTAQGVRATFAGLSDEIANLKVSGPNANFFQALNALKAFGGEHLDYHEYINGQGELTNVEGFASAISAGLSKVHDVGQRRAYAQRLHIDPSNFRVLTQSNEELKKQLDLQEKIGYVTQQQGENSDKLLKSFAALSQQALDFANIIQDDINPYLTNTLGILNSIASFFSHRTVVNAIEFGAKSFIPGIGAIRAIKDLHDIFGGGGDSTAPTPTGASNPPRAGNVKAGANVPVGLYALASSLGGIPGFKQITAGNDAYHAGRPSKHNQGLALDFTLKDAQQADAITSAINAKFASMGIDAKALDEYNHPSANATGPHIHVAFANQKALEKYNASRGDGVTINVQTLTVQANNPKELANAVTQSNPGLRNRMKATSGNQGFQ